MIYIYFKCFYDSLCQRGIFRPTLDTEQPRLITVDDKDETLTLVTINPLLVEIALL